MTTRRRVGGPRRGRWSGQGPALAAVIVAILAACGTAAPPASSPAGSIAPPTSASPVALATPSPASAAPSPSAGPSALPSAVLDPAYCPATLPEPDEVTPDGIAIEGDEAFVEHVGRALALLAGADPESYADVVAHVTRIRQVESFSGMCYDTGTYRVGEETAYAPGHLEAAQVVWLAGTIVHDGCHRARFVAGLVPGGKDGEVACLELQEVTLRRIAAHPFFADYVRELIEGADDPENQYWTAEDRHW